MSSDFHGESLLVPGKLTGIRHFNVDPLGRLTGVSEEAVWKPGKNVAECRSNWSCTERGLKPSKVAGATCSCGFYAYFNEKERGFTNDVRAIIDGWGQATVGQKGFRCEKAEIVAFIGSSWPKLHKGFWIVLLSVLAISGMAILISPILAALTPAVVAAELFFMTVVNGMPVVTLPHPLPKEVRKLYPLVPTYATVYDALKVHPLTKPEPESPITPETTPDFWSRPA